MDTRLRPFGSAGPLAMSFRAMEDYYQSQAREWERYAMIKARVVAGEPAAAAQITPCCAPSSFAATWTTGPSNRCVSSSA